MRDPFEAWYVRLPDGRVVRAKTTASVRHHVESGRIPVDSWVRRRGDDDWSSLEWTSEFADAVSARRKQDARPVETKPEPQNLGNDAPVRDGHELRTVGVRGLVEELLTALDSTLSRRKLVIAGLTCLGVSGVLVATALVTTGLVTFASWDSPLPWIAWGLSWLVQVILLAAGTALLSQITFVELSRFRQARREEVFGQLQSIARRIAGSYLIVASAVALAIIGVRMLPGWVVAQGMAEPIPAVAVAASLVLEVLLWPVLGLCLLLGPVVIIEDVGVCRSIVLCWSLVRHHLGRVLLYQGLALAIGVVITIPFLLPVWLAGTQGRDEGTALVTLSLLGGCAMTPLFAYLVVANVFIYLNLRYEFSASGRE